MDLTAQSNATVATSTVLQLDAAIHCIKQLVNHLNRRVGHRRLSGSLQRTKIRALVTAMNLQSSVTNAASVQRVMQMTNGQYKRKASSRRNPHKHGKQGYR